MLMPQSQSTPPKGVVVQQPPGHAQTPHTENMTLMKATTLLQKHHRNVDAVLLKLERGALPASGPRLAHMATNLAGHLSVEEEIFNPAVRGMSEMLAFQAHERLVLARFALERLLATKPEDTTFQAKVTALRELVLQHVKKNEETIFPKVEKALDEKQLVELGAQMKIHFQEVVEWGAEAVLARLRRRPTFSDLSSFIAS